MKICKIYYRLRSQKQKKTRTETRYNIALDLGKNCVKGPNSALQKNVLRISRHHSNNFFLLFQIVAVVAESLTALPTYTPLDPASPGETQRPTTK